MIFVCKALNHWFFHRFSICQTQSSGFNNVNHKMRNFSASLHHWKEEVRSAGISQANPGCRSSACDLHDHVLHTARRCQGKTPSPTLDTLIALRCLQTCLSRWHGCHFSHQSWCFPASEKKKTTHAQQPKRLILIRPSLRCETTN